MSVGRGAWLTTQYSSFFACNRTYCYTNSSLRWNLCNQHKSHLPLRFSIRSYQQYAKLNVPKRIHIIGSGAVGKLIAHSLRRLPDPPPVTLIYHRVPPFNHFINANQTLTLKSNNIEETSHGFDTQLYRPVYDSADFGTTDIVWKTYRPRNEENDETVEVNWVNEAEPIYNLVVSLKAYQALGAISNLASRLSSDSSILFLNAGMGIIEELNEKLFPDPEQRPSYLIGVSSHGVRSDGATVATQYRHGSIQIGLIPRATNATLHQNGSTTSTESTERLKQNQTPEPSRPQLKARRQAIYRPIDPDTSPDPWPQQSRYLLRTIASSPALAAVAVSPLDIMLTQLDKLALDCLIEPLTAIMDCRNGNLLDNFAVSRTMYLLIAEIVLVIRALPELQGIVNIPLRFSPARINARAVATIRKTPMELSSTLQAMRRGQKTELEYINGYIVRRGEELGIKPAMNYMALQMVTAKHQMISREVNAYTPMGSPILY